MNNEPVAWMDKKGNCVPDDVKQFEANNGDWFGGYTIPLYTHPAKHLSLQKVDGELVAVTYTDDEHRIIEVLWEKPPAKTLTDEEIYKIAMEVQTGFFPQDDTLEFAKALLRKAQEK